MAMAPRESESAYLNQRWYIVQIWRGIDTVQKQFREDLRSLYINPMLIRL